MSSIQCRGTITLTAVVVALLSSRPVEAQVGVDPLPPRRPVSWHECWRYGTWWDTTAEAHAEHQFAHAQAKYGRDAARGDSAAVARDAHRIDHARYRIAVADWLIRKNTFQCVGYYPPRHPEVHYIEPCAPTGVSTPPPQAPYAMPPVPTPEPTTASPTIPITIVNADEAGAAVDFAINGVAQQVAGGSRQDLAVAPDSNLTYDAGGSLGQRRYLLSSGLYEFRSTPEGRALYKLPDKP